MTVNTLKVLTFIAAAAMFLPLPVMQYVAEESYYALGAYEIFVDKHWWHQSVFGMPWPKTPLYNWLIIAVSQVIGWQHLEIATRIVSVAASLGSATVVFFMARRFLPQAQHAPWLGALIYLTMGEISFWYGWLGYADATFGFFIFSAISCLWIAIEDKSFKWFLLSLLLISLAFFTKNISCYVIYASAAIILLWRYNQWQLLIKPHYIIFVLLVFSLPWVYQHIILGGGTNTTVAINDALRHFLGYGVGQYLSHWVTFPLLFLARAFPLTLVLAWFYFKDKKRFALDHRVRTLTYILLLCLVPYWLSATGTPRYLVPFYGLLALLITYLTMQLNSKQIGIAIKAIIIVLLLKIPYSFAALPYIKDWRPERDIRAVVEDIMQITAGKTLRTMNDVSTGLSIGCYINVRTPDDHYIRWYNGNERQVYILSEVENPELGTLMKYWRLRGHHTYLYWKP